MIGYDITFYFTKLLIELGLFTRRQIKCISDLKHICL